MFSSECRVEVRSTVNSSARDIERFSVKTPGTSRTSLNDIANKPTRSEHKKTDSYRFQGIETSLIARLLFHKTILCTLMPHFSPLLDRILLPALITGIWPVEFPLEILFFCNHPGAFLPHADQPFPHEVVDYTA